MVFAIILIPYLIISPKKNSFYALILREIQIHNGLMSLFKTTITSFFHEFQYNLSFCVILCTTAFYWKKWNLFCTFNQLSNSIPLQTANLAHRWIDGLLRIFSKGATFRYFTSYTASKPAARSAVVFRKMETKTNGTKQRSIAVDTEDEDEPLDPTPEEVSKPEKEDPNQGVLFYLVNNHMWIFAIWLIPISICYDIFWFYRTRINYWLSKRNVSLKHEEKVR